MTHRTTVGALCLCLVLAALTTGCGPRPAPVASAGPPVIPVSQPVQRDVIDFVDFTGRTDAVESVSVRARVTGYLVNIPFKEGSEVKKGDVLFEIDPRPYEAQLKEAQAQVAVNRASLKLAQANLARDQPLVATGAVSAQQLDQDRAAVDQAQALVDASLATVDVYKLNLEFTKVTSPIDGMVSRYFLTVGNLVTQDQSQLTTVVSLDPMYAYFDMDEPTLLRIRRAINEGKIKPRGPTQDVPALVGLPGLFAVGPWVAALTTQEIPVFMGLQGEEGFPHRGSINFVNNVVNPSTGTIAVRGVFPNPLPPGGRRLLSPGMFVRIRLPISQPHPALLVIDRAVGSDQGLPFVYVVDAEHKVQYRRVTTGSLQEDGLRVVNTGLNPDDWVVTGGLMQVRPRMEVQPEPMPMPSLEAPGQAPAPVNNRAQPPPPGGNQKEGQRTKDEGQKTTGK